MKIFSLLLERYGSAWPKVELVNVINQLWNLEYDYENSRVELNLVCTQSYAKFFNYLKLVYRSFYRYRYTKCVKAQLYHSEQSCITVNYVKYHGISRLFGAAFEK